MECYPECYPDTETRFEGMARWIILVGDYFHLEIMFSDSIVYALLLCLSRRNVELYYYIAMHKNHDKKKMGKYVNVMYNRMCHVCMSHSSSYEVNHP